MPVLIALVGLAGALAGIAVGWYLRSVNPWCPHCGAAVSCTACGERPSWPHRSTSIVHHGAEADHHA